MMLPAMNTHAIPANDRPATQRVGMEPPGGVLVWLILFVELLTFGMGLVVFLVQSHDAPDVFRSGRTQLNQSIGMANTLVLLSGGWFMASSLVSLRAARQPQAERWLEATIGSGVLFLILKGFEYADKLQHGLDLHADTFFTLYWLLTGFHFVHVVVAIMILMFMWRGLRRGSYTFERHEDIQGAGVFWHMCDLIWLLVYPVVYLLR